MSHQLSGGREPWTATTADIVHGLGRRLRLAPLMAHHNHAAVLGTFALVNGFISIALMSLLALVTQQPFIFPSLGPTAFLLFYTPHAAAASPRNALTGHLIGVVSGYLSLVVFGLQDAGPAVQNVDWARIGAAALSLGLTAGVMVWFNVPHPPAGATTLIVSLGILSRPADLVVLMLGVVVLLLHGFTINRLAGLDYPIWAPRFPAHAGTTRAHAPASAGGADKR